MTIQYTTNRNYPKPDFDTRTWHQQMWQSLDMIDADITAELQGVSGFVVEAWDNNRGYLINAKVMDVDRLQLYVCNVNHTSAASGNFTADRTAHPTYWTSFGVPLVPRGVWAQNTAYNVMDHVYDTVQGVSAICALAHTSTVSGNIRTDASKWLFIVDLQVIMGSNVITSPTTGVLFTLRSTDPGAGPAPDLLLDRASASPAVNDQLGRIVFNGNNAALVDATYGAITAKIIDPAAATLTGNLSFIATVNNVASERFRIGAGFFYTGGADMGNFTINAFALYEAGTLISAKYAPIASPVFTGDPRAPTPTAGDNDTSIATTAFVTASFLTVTNAAATYLPLAGGTLTGNLSINPAAGAASIILNPTTAAQQANFSFYQTGVAKWQFGKQTDDSLFLYDSAAAGYVFTAPSNGTTLTINKSALLQGVPTAPTPATGDRSTKIATTAFVGKGVTDGSNPAAGDIGEFLTANATGVAVANNTLANIVSLVLTAGDWDVWGGAFVTPSGASLSVWLAGISTVSLTTPAQYSIAEAFNSSSFYLGASGLAPPMQRVNVSVSTTVYMVAQASFTGGTCAAQGILNARRRR